MPQLDSRQNYFAAASEIAQRVRDKCPVIRRVVLGMQRIAGDSLALPLAVVVQMGDSVASSSNSPGRGAITVNQNWQVQLYIDRTDEESAYDESGFLMGDIFQALQGWRPKGASGSLYKTDSPAAVFHEKEGFAVFAHNFVLPVLVKVSAD